MAGSGRVQKSSVGMVLRELRRADEILQLASAFFAQAELNRPSLRSQRAQRDEALVPQIERVWRANLQVYGAKKVWRQLGREGQVVARCTVERLMRRQGLRGVIRGKVVRTTVSDPKMPCPLDKVNRKLRADRPNQLWVWPRLNGCPGSTWKRQLDAPEWAALRWAGKAGRRCGLSPDTTSGA